MRILRYTAIVVALVAMLTLSSCATAGQAAKPAAGGAAPAKPAEPGMPPHATAEQQSLILFHLSQGYLALQDGNGPLALEHFNELDKLGYRSAEVYRMKAVILIQGGAIDRALQEIDEAVKLDPKDVESLGLKAGVLAAKGDRAQAVEIYQQILKLDPSNESAALFSAGLYEELNDVKKARKTLESFAQKHPDASLVQFELGRLHLVAGEYADAKNIFLRQTKAEPENVRAWVGLGFADEGLGDRAHAIAAYQEAIKLNPNDRALRRELINLYLRQNNTDAAMAEANKLEILGGGASDALLTRGVVLYQEGKTAEALAQFNLALEREPNNQRARYLAAACQARLNHLPEAIETYRKIPHDSDYYLDARTNVALILMRLNKNGDALVELDLLAQQYPQEVDVLRTRATVLSAMGRNEDAEETLQKALKLKPNDAELTYTLAILYEKTDRWRQAIGLMDKRLEHDPDDVDAMNFIGYTLADHKSDLPRAERLLARAVQLKPNSGHIVDSYGWVLYRMGQYDAAITQLTRALDLEPSEAVIAEHVGDAFAAKGEQATAREWWRKALTLNPEPDTLARVKEKLGEK